MKVCWDLSNYSDFFFSDFWYLMILHFVFLAILFIHFILEKKIFPVTIKTCARWLRNIITSWTKIIIKLFFPFYLEKINIRCNGAIKRKKWIFLVQQFRTESITDFPSETSIFRSFHGNEFWSPWANLFARISISGRTLERRTRSR